MMNDWGFFSANPNRKHGLRAEAFGFASGKSAPLPSILILQLITSILVLLLLNPIAHSQSVTVTETFAEQLKRWDLTFELIEQDLRRSDIDRQTLQRLDAILVRVWDQALAARHQADINLDIQQRLLDALDAPQRTRRLPATETTSDVNQDVAATRAALMTQFDLILARAQQASLTLERIEVLRERMAATEYRVLRSTLAEHTVQPFSTVTLTKALQQLKQRINILIADSAKDWQHTWSTGRSIPLLQTLAVLLLCVAITFALRHWLHIRQRQLYLVSQPTLNQRLLATLVAVVSNLIVPLAALGIMGLALSELRPFTAVLENILFNLLQALSHTVLIIGLAAAILAPPSPSWHITQFTPASAAALFRALRRYAFVVLAVLILVLFVDPHGHHVKLTSGEAIGEYFAVDREFSSVLGMLLLLVMGGLVLDVLRAQHWQFVSPDSTHSAQAPAKPWRYLLILARIVLICSLILGASGYLNASMFLLDRVGGTLMLVGLALLLRVLLATALRQLGNTVVGNQLRRFLALDDAGLGRLSFWLLLLLDLLIIATVLGLLALYWGVPSIELERLLNILVFGVDIGGVRLTLAKLGLTLVVFFLLLTMVRLLQRFLTNRVLIHTQLDVGVRDALNAGVGYLGLTVTILIAITMLGLDLSHLALIVGALSIGIGFGLQHVVNNFVSGLILLVQRPIKTGDWIVVGNHQGHVKSISTISTEIQTFDNATVVVPNSNLLSNEMLNWTHKSTLGRAIIAVGVAYDSDPKQVNAVLLSCAQDNDDVLKLPEPRALLLNFGPSTLEFELRFYIKEIGNVLQVTSDLRTAIKAAFEAAGIVIAFPQQDIHLRDLSVAANNDIVTSQP